MIKTIRPIKYNCGDIFPFPIPSYRCNHWTCSGKPPPPRPFRRLMLFLTSRFPIFFIFCFWEGGTPIWLRGVPLPSQPGGTPSFQTEGYPILPDGVPHPRSGRGYPWYPMSPRSGGGYPQPEQHGGGWYAGGLSRSQYFRGHSLFTPKRWPYKSRSTVHVINCSETSFQRPPIFKR